jgi:hypothetical protein
VGAPALTHAFTVGACGISPRRGPPTALPGAGVWRCAWGDGAHCRSAAQQGHGTHCPRFLVPQPNGKQQNLGHQLRGSFDVDSRFETARSSSAFNFFGLESKLFSKFQIDSKRELGSIVGSLPPVSHRAVTESHNFRVSVAAISAGSPLYCSIF